MKIFDSSSIGIDFRQEHLILTLLKRPLGRIKLVDYAIHPIPSETQKEERQAQVISLVNSFFSKHQVNRERVSIAIPREKVIARFIRLPVAAKENLRKVLEYEMPKYVPFEKGEIYFDYCVLKEEKDWLHLFAMFAKKTEVDGYLSLLKKMKIQPISIQIPSTAAVNLFFYNKGGNESDTSVLIDVSELFFEMNLVQGKDWTESVRLPLPGEEKEAKMISTFQRSGENRLPANSTFFVYGLAADETTLVNLKETKQLKDVLLPPMDHMQGGEGASKPHKIYASIGIPLKGFVSPRIDLNLLPLEMRKKVREIGKPVLIALTSLAVLLTLTWGGGTFIRYTTELNTVNAEIKKRRPEVEALEKLQKQRDNCCKEMSELDQIRSTEVSKVEVLQELTKVIPDTTWIWNLKYNGKEIELSGFADSASDLIPILDKSPLFEKVEFMAPVTKEMQMRGDGNKEKERFKIKARIERRK
ncbi:MAG TPA: PilN domain-containing protein [Thermodesulfobacteriota bacterium]|nr:PilN domain-containing protein [Thermodesulfobacteriota bacterium]